MNCNRLRMDVTVKENIQAAVDTISCEEGMLHILVNK